MENNNKIEQPALNHDNLNQAYREDETQCVNALIAQANLPSHIQQAARTRAENFIQVMREQQHKYSGVENFLAQYSLSTAEGVALMCLAEAMLRIPDKATITLLIKDKLISADWKSHIGKSDSLFVNASTWGLLLSGHVLQTPKPDNYFDKTLKRIFRQMGEPVVRHILARAMKIISRQFVMGETLPQAMKRAGKLEAIGYCYSYDMLGEAARTAEDAQRYFDAYLQAIEQAGQQIKTHTFIAERTPSISVKLSALHPRYEYTQRDRVLAELVPRVLHLAQVAKANNVDLTLDAEESHRLSLMLDVFAAVFSDDSLEGWHGFGLAVQAYQKRAWYVIDWLAALSRTKSRRIKVRLVKGAYWDSEVKESQMLGLSGYPVFTRKASTDISYQACSKKLLSLPECFFPQFATHNAYTVAMILELAGERRDFEFQCLHGMGQALYEQIVPKDKLNIACRIYAPVGSQQDLLPYLVRRLLENGANVSFVNQLTDKKVSVAELVMDPVEKIASLNIKAHSAIPLPSDIFPEARKNSRGIDLSNELERLSLIGESQEMLTKNWMAAPIIAGKEHYVKGREIFSPGDNKHHIGYVQDATAAELEHALASAASAAESWDATPVIQRAACLERAADLLEKHRAEFITLAIHEAGKTMADAISEVREAIDYCRYYAQQAVKIQSNPLQLQGYTGESNELQLHGRGVMVCISPWNFPLAIFIGQVAACLATGNSVIAKPAKQTVLIAALAVRLLHAAGIPGDVLHLVPAPGEMISNQLLADSRVAGVLLTGSTATAQTINQRLAARKGPIIPLIAETGGLNAMIVDSSALVEQVVADAMLSAFNSAGQRCSALRVLFVQKDIADKFLHMLQGAMAELRIGDPSLLETDIGPVIDAESKDKLEKHAKRMDKEAKLICAANLTAEAAKGHFFAPRVYTIDRLQCLTEEVFGPILHIITFSNDELAEVVKQINDSGFGLTLGIQSRITETINYIQQHAHVGNCYVNRNMIGAVVGLQPFGGEGLSGTGPKAGGPHYLYRLCHERTLTINTTAVGGNTALASMAEG